MEITSIINPQGKLISNLISPKILSKYPNIISDPEIHSGFPHIKGTRILASDIFRSVAYGYSFQELLMQFKEMKVKITEKQLEEAFSFIAEWTHFIINGKKTFTR